MFKDNYREAPRDHQAEQDFQERAWNKLRAEAADAVVDPYYDPVVYRQTQPRRTEEEIIAWLDEVSEKVTPFLGEDWMEEDAWRVDEAIKEAEYVD